MLPTLLKGGEGGPPKPPVQAFLLFCNEKRADAIKELATGAAGADSAKTESAPKEKEGDEEMEDPEEPEEPEDEEDEDEEGGKKKGKGGKGGKGGGMAANAAIIKKLGAMWATASAEEKPKFEERVAKEKEARVAEICMLKQPTAFTLACSVSSCALLTVNGMMRCATLSDRMRLSLTV